MVDDEVLSCSCVKKFFFIVWVGNVVREWLVVVFFEEGRIEVFGFIWYGVGGNGFGRVGVVGVIVSCLEDFVFGWYFLKVGF